MTIRNIEPVPVQVFSDYICPWCYVGLSRIERVGEELPLAIEWRPFFLRPDIPPEGAPRRQRPGEPPTKAGEQVTGQLGEQAAEEGLIMKRSERTPYTRLALEATEYSKTQGLVDQYHEALLKAYWEHSQNLGDTEVLLSIAKEVSLNQDGLAQALETRSFEQTVLEQVQLANEIGINAIPAYIVGKYLFFGAQPYSFMKSVVERVLRERAEGEQEIALK